MNINQIVLWAVLLIIVILAVYKLKIAGKGQWHDDFLSLDTSKAMLGIAAIFIVLHHISQLMGNLEMDQGPFKFIEYIGVSLVGLFFFFSGYGLFSSKNNRQDYFKGFLKKRLTTILVPFYVINFIFVAFAIIIGEDLTAAQLVAYGSGWWLLNTQMWYVVEIAIFYIAFYLIFKNIKNDKTGLVIMGLFIGAFVLLSLVIGHGAECECDKWLQGEWWFNTSFMFLIGMIFAYNEDTVVTFFKKNFFVIIMLCIIAGVGFTIPTISMVDEGYYYCEYAEDMTMASVILTKLMTLAVQFAMVFFFDMIVLLLMMKVKLRNVILDKLGKVSLVLYLSHNLFLITFGNLEIGGFTQPCTLVPMALICALITAFILQVPINALPKLILKNKK